MKEDYMLTFDFSYRKLNVYQHSKLLVKEIYRLMESFPKTENFALCDQLRRAVVSIPSNIVEGTTRVSPKEQYRFIEIAFGSLMEVMCQMEIALDLGYVSEEDFSLIEDNIISIYKMLSSMQSSIKNRM